MCFANSYPAVVTLTGWVDSYTRRWPPKRARSQEIAWDRASHREIASKVEANVRDRGIGESATPERASAKAGSNPLAPI